MKNCMTKKDKWLWMPHPAHFICARDCKFFLATKVGKYIISTVGEYFPDSRVRAIFAECRGIKIEGKGDEYDYNYMKKIGFEELHADKTFYETMVFKAVKVPKNDKRSCESCPFRIDVQKCFDEVHYKTSAEAMKGHYKLCAKFSKK